MHKKKDFYWDYLFKLIRFVHFYMITLFRNVDRDSFD